MDKEFYQAFCDICFYNGYEEYLLQLINYLKTKKDIRDRLHHQIDYIAQIPPFVKELNDTERIEHIIWSILVLMFGDYGISPRYGWIEKYEEAIDFLFTILIDIKKGSDLI